MASGHSDQVENKILDKLYGRTDFTPPATYYIGLFTASPSDAGGGTELTIGTNRYARIAVTNDTTNFPAAAAGSKTNGVAFTSAVSTGAWGSGAAIVAVGFFDAASAGTMWDWGDIPVGNQQSITGANQQWSLPVGALTLTEN